MSLDLGPESTYNSVVVFSGFCPAKGVVTAFVLLEYRKMFSACCSFIWQFILQRRWGKLSIFKGIVSFKGTVRSHSLVI